MKFSCPVCSESMDVVGEAKYYTKDEQFNTKMLHCKDCDIFYRNVDDEKLIEHYYSASYIKLENERRFFEQRKDFFRNLLKLTLQITQRHQLTNHISSQNIKLADFGSSYGHLLEIGNELGFETTGIELNKDLVDFCNQKGLQVYPNITEINEKFDVLTLVDSLYCVPNPLEILSSIKQLLEPQGLLVIRITNRNFYAWINQNIFKKDLTILGDATVSYSMKGLKRLLERSGFKIIEVVPDNGKTKKLRLKTKALYLATSWITYVLFQKVILTPGVIVFAKKAD